MCCAAIVATLPDLAWGVGGKVAAGASIRRRGRRPPRVINADPRPVAVLPVDSMRHFAWAGDAPVLDPLPRWLRADVLTTGDLTIGGRTVPGEGERAARFRRLLIGGADRRQAGRRGRRLGRRRKIGRQGRRLRSLPVAYRDDDLDGCTASAATHPAASGRGIVLAAHWLWLGLLLGAAGVTLLRVFRRSTGTVLRPARRADQQDGD